MNGGEINQRGKFSEQQPQGGGVNKPHLHPPKDQAPDMLYWEKDKRENPIIKERDKARIRASDIQRRVAEIQAARYERRTIYRLMTRSGDNRKLVNGLNNFTRA